LEYLDENSILVGELVDVFISVWMICYIDSLYWLLEIFKKELESFYPSAHLKIYGWFGIILSFKRVLQILIPALA
jgi:hypothetical protein